MKDLSCNITLNKINKEINSQGTEEFPVAKYKENLKIQSVPYHWHEEIEFIVVTSGEMELVVELEKIVIKKGEGIFINSGRLHSCSDYNNSNCTIKSFVFHPRFIYGETTSILYQKYFHSLLQEASTDFLYLENKLCEEILKAHEILEENFAYEILLQGSLSEIMIEVLKLVKNLKKPSTSKERKILARCKKMVLFIRENYNKEITLLDIGNSGGVKESECLRTFKMVLNISPIKYLKNTRLENAELLIKTTTFPIIDISLDCGFSDTSYFTKSFKEKYKMTPSEYRKNNFIQ